jgi:hypothetical protein
LQYSLASLTNDYEIITRAVDDSLELAHVLEVVDARHRVDTEWLSAQKTALAVLEAEGAAQLAYEQRARTAVTMTSYEPALEPEPTVDRGFGIEHDL